MATSTRAEPHPDVGTELVRDWEPEGAPKAHIVLVHGIAEHSGRYERPGSLLAEAGFWVRGFDLIGAGGSGGRRWDIDDWSRYHDQVQGHLEWAREKGGPVILMGHSLGGTIALGYALSNRPEPDLLVLSGPALTGGAGWQRALAPFMARLTPSLSVPNSVDVGHLSRDPAVVEAYLADPLVHTSSTCRFGANAFEEIDRLNDEVMNLNIPTYVFHGGDDRVVPTEASAVLDDLRNVDRKVYPGLRHETLNEPEGPEVVADLVDWLDTHL